MNAALWLLWVAPLAGAAQAATGEGSAWAHDALAHAIMASTRIEDPFRRAQSLAEVAEIGVSVDGAPAALALLQSASDSAGKIDNESLASWARHDIALAYVKTGELEGAQRIAATVTDLRLRDEVLDSVVTARRAARDIPGALAVARRIQDPRLQGRALRETVLAQAAAGDMQDALATARSIGHPAFSALALGDVVAAFARAGNIAEAQRLAIRIRNDEVRGHAFADIAGAQVSVDDDAGALATVTKIDDKLARANALAKLAEARTAHGSAIAARELFSQSVALASRARGDAERRCSTFIEIARSQVGAGEVPAARATLQLALEALSDVKRSGERLPLLAQIVPLQARVGDHAAAMATAWKTEDASLRPLLARDVATSQAEAGDVAGALRAARSLDDEHAGAAAFFGILRVQSRARDAPRMHDTIETALATVRVLHSRELMTGALAALAAARLAAGERDGARVLFDEAMQVAAQLPDASAQAAGFVRIADALAEPAR